MKPLQWTQLYHSSPGSVWHHNGHVMASDNHILVEFPAGIEADDHALAPQNPSMVDVLINAPGDKYLPAPYRESMITCQCEACEGKGTVPVWVACLTCRGVGFVNGLSCPRCNGRGEIKTAKMWECIYCYGTGTYRESKRVVIDDYPSRPVINGCYYEVIQLLPGAQLGYNQSMDLFLFRASNGIRGCVKPMLPEDADKG